MAKAEAMSKQPFTQWNDARSAAAKIVSYTKNERENIPKQLEDELNMKALKQKINEFSGTRSELVNSVARYLLGKENAFSSEQTEDQSEQTEKEEQLSWNDARSISSTLLQLEENNSLSIKNLDDVEYQFHEKEETITTVKRIAESSLSRSDSVNELSRWIRNPEREIKLPAEKENTQQEETVNEATDVTFSENKKETKKSTNIKIAEDLVECFIDHTSRYVDVVNKYDRDFPSRDIALMDVMNSYGQNRQERVKKIAEKITEWDDEEKQEEKMRSVPQRNPRRK